MWRSSHAQHLADRFGMGYARDGRWHRPLWDVVSMFVDQPPARQLCKADLAPLRAAEFGATIYTTIAEALRCGGAALAVDAVLIVGEHGQYASNRYGQQLYPRWEFFQAVTQVFRQDGRSVPVFSDKHLSYDFDRAVQMVQASRNLGFVLLAGSSLPCGYRMPPLELPLGRCEVREALVVCSFEGDGGWFHGLESLQCMVERRRGGETGVATVHATKGDDVWPSLESGLSGRGGWDEGGVDPELLEHCLCRSQQLRNVEEVERPLPAASSGATAEGGGISTEPLYSWRFPTARQARAVVSEPRMIRIQYRDGTRGSVLFLKGLVGDLTFAVRIGSSSSGDDVVLSTLFNNDTIAPMSFRNFGTASLLMQAVEDMFETGKAPWPIERNLLTTGLTAAAAESFHSSGAPLATHQLASVRYLPLTA
jgi:hypothetical protein